MYLGQYQRDAVGLTGSPFAVQFIRRAQRWQHYRVNSSLYGLSQQTACALWFNAIVLKHFVCVSSPHAEFSMIQPPSEI